MSHSHPFEHAEEANMARWNESALIHEKAYQEIEMLRRGEEILDPLELAELGDVEGKRMLHIQCHIGTDSLAWARHGAVVTGIDFSEEAVGVAERLRDELDVEARFIQSNVYDLARTLAGEENTYDIVYTSRGVLCWLRDLDVWARLIARFLRPGGTFYILESHPFLNTLEEQDAGTLSFDYPYFHRTEPMFWKGGEPDYADVSQIVKNPSYEWVWSISEIMTALLKAGLRIESFGEHERLFFRLYPSMATDDGRNFRLKGYEGKLPLIFTLGASKP